MKRSLHQRWSNIAVNVALAALVVAPVYAATTVGTNMSTGGTLSVTGASTLTGAVTATGGVVSGANVTVPAAYSLDAASTGVLNIGTTTATTINIGRSGQLAALLGNATVAGTLGVTGATTLSSTLGVTGATTLSATSTHTYISNGLGFVGAPSYTFTGDLTNGIWSSGASTLNFSTGGSERARIDTNGRLGIGTTTPGTPLSVTGAGVFTGPLTFTWLNATSTTATSTLSTGGLTVGTNQFVVQQTSGSVGIGTTSPASLFSVAGSGYLTGGLGLGILNTTAGTLTLLPAANAISVLAVKNAAGTNIFTVDTLAGGTTTLANFLNVTGAVTSTSTFTGGLAANLLNITSTTATSTAANGLNLTAGCFAVNAVCVGPGTVLSGTAGQLPYYGSTGTALTATSSIFLTTSSYFGIGTTSPNQLLSLFSATTPSLEFSSASGPTNKWTMGIDTADANKFKIASSTAVGTNARLTIDGNGNLGIGSTTPSHLFSVHGNALISGTSYFGAAITATSTLSVTGLTTMGNATATALTVGSATGNLYINGYATTTGANGNIATAGTLGVTGASTLTGGVTVGTGNAITGIIGGYCTFSDVTSFTASTTKYTDCTTTPTGALTTATRVLVQATSSLQSMYVIQAASSTGVSTINLRILNTGLDGAADTTLEGTSINFWAFR